MQNLAYLDVDLVNIHALGGGEMIEFAKEGLLAGNSSGYIYIIDGTVQTSINQGILNIKIKLPGDLNENVVHFASLSKKHGADGVVCSVHESQEIKKECGGDFLTVTPGIRLTNTDQNDQKRIATPKVAR